MGNTLTGQVVAETYDSLLKVTDNNQITGTKKRLTDGFGTDTPLLVSTTDVQVDGNFLIESAQFNTATIQTGGVGKLIWNDQDGTLDLGLKGGNVTLQVGQEQVIRVVNKTGSNLLEANYQVVRVDGAQGNRLKVALAQANNDANSAETLGLVTETINDNQEGFITTSGLVRKINTTGSLQGETWADGDMLYLSGTTAGKLTNIKPTAPTHTVIMGYVVSAHATQGQIYVKVDNGYELNELHNVLITTPTDGQVLAYESATGLWKNTSNGNVGGSGTTNYIAKFTGSTTLGNSRIFDNGTNVGIGTTSPVALLDVYDSVLFKGLRVGRIISGSWFNEYSADAHIFQTGFGLERMRITSAGNIGIGTSTPSTKLDVNGDITSSGLIYSNLINSTFTVGSKLGLPVLGSSPSADPVYHSLHSTNENELTWLQPSSIGGDSPSTFKAVNTAARVYTFPDATGTVALTSNINSAISGTTNYLSKFTGSNSIGNSQVFDNGTNVGIGTASPTNKFEVFQANNSSAFSIRNGTTSSHNLLYAGNDSSTNSSFIGSYKGDGSFYSNLELQKFGGNVGIGTSTPAYPLQVNGLISSNRTSNTDGGLVFGTPANGNYFYGADSGNYIATYTANSERMRITSGGNVGIGTTSPVSISGYTTLDVRGTNGSLLYMGTTSTSSLRLIGEGTDAYIDNLTSGGALLFRTNNATERMRITSGGNVGIGLTNPLMKLDVYGTSGLPATSGTTPVGSLRLHASNNAVLDFGVDHGTANGWIQSSDQNGLNNYYGLLLNPRGGNVGIGTTNPSTYKLHVEGGQFNVKALSNGSTDNGICYTAERVSNGYAHYFVNSGNGVGSIYLNASSTSYNTSSDYRLKEDLKEINGLDKLSKLRVYDFKWKNSEERMDGVLAHELQEVIPYAVTGEKDGEQMQAVDYSKLVPVLVKAIQEQQAQIEELKAKLN